MSMTEIPTEYVEAFKEKYPEFVGKFFDAEGHEGIEFVGYQASNYYNPIWYRRQDGRYNRTSALGMYFAKGIVVGYSDGTTQTIGGKGA